MRDDLLNTLAEFKTRYVHIIHHYRRCKEETGNVAAVEGADGADESKQDADIEPPLPPVVVTEDKAAAAGATTTTPLHWKLSIYDDVVLVEEYDYWMFRAMSRWWYSQSRTNVYNYFDREFWSLLRFLEQCEQCSDGGPSPTQPTQTDAQPSDERLLSECVEFMEELMPALVHLKAVYPDYEMFHELLQDIVDSIVVYHEAMDDGLKSLSRKRLLESAMLSVS